MRQNIFKQLARIALTDGGSLKDKVLRSGIWVAADKVVLSVLGVLRSVVLARLLTPEIFGLIGLAQIGIRTIEVFTRPGIGEALIARRQSFEEASATAFTLLLARGVLLAALMYLAAPYIARFYETKQLELVIQVLAFGFIIEGFRNIRHFERRRELEFRELTYLSQAAAWTNAVVAISCAYWFRNVWALVIGQLSAALVITILSYAVLGGRPRIAFDRLVARQLLSYGKFVTASGIVLFFANELDSAVIGKYLGIEQLGYYALALSISQMATSQISSVASNVMMPAYSKLQGDREALGHAYLLAVGMVMFIVVPAVVGAVLMADPLVRVIYGEKWVAAIAPLRVMMLFGLFSSLVIITGYLFQGIGRPSIPFRLALLRLVVLAILLFPMLVMYGLTGGAIAVTFAVSMQALAGLRLLQRELAITVGQLFRSVRRTIVTSLVMGTAVFLVSQVLTTDTLAGLIGVIAVGVVVYTLLNLTYLRTLRADFLRSRTMGG